MTSNSSPLQRLIEYTGRYQTQLRLAIVASILNKIFDLAPPILIGIAVDVVVKQENSQIANLGITSIFGQLVLVSLVSAVVWILESVFEYAYERLWRNLAQTIQHHLRLDGYRHLQNLEIAYFEEHSTGELMSILNDDINQLERFLDVGANEVIQVVTTVLVIGSTFLILSPQVGWMTIAPMPFIIWGSIAYQKLLAPRYAKVREKAGLINQRLANNLSGITTIKSFTAEEYETQRVAQDSQAYRRSNEDAIAYSAAFIPLVRMLILIGFTCILLYGGLEVTNGNLAVGTYSTLVFMTQRLLWPLTSLGNTLDLCQRAMASTRRVMGLLDTPITIHPGKTPLPIESVRGEVIFHDVSFAYRDRLSVLNHVFLTIPAGQTIAIVGSTGSGKSTLVKLLLRLYEIQQGKITVDGIELQKLHLEDLRRCIGLVSQDVFLFHGTVAENIAYGTFDASEPDIIAAATLAEAHEFIMELPQQYDTIVGERGQKLSGGQRQRLAIARAILKNPPILILDEATSAVDNETEAAIQRSLDRITKNRTTIAIAHRLSTIRNAHCIYVMEQGKIIESGSHDDLLNENGIYSSLWRIQMGELVLKSK